MITVTEGDVDIGANPSAEDAEESAESTSQTVNNVVYSFRLTETSFDKKSYMTYIKGYMKAIKSKLQESNPDRVPEFEKKAATLVKKIIANFKVEISYIYQNEIHETNFTQPNFFFL
jgi:hypothetical protein